MVKRKIKARKRNPDLKESLLNSIPIPRDPRDAFDLGRFYGMKIALDEYCDLNFLKKRKIKEIINKAIEKSLIALEKDLNRR